MLPGPSVAIPPEAANVPGFLAQRSRPFLSYLAMKTPFPRRAELGLVRLALSERRRAKEPAGHVAVARIIDRNAFGFEGACIGRPNKQTVPVVFGNENSSRLAEHGLGLLALS